ncbi:MAG TPA: hypothetical protein DCF63_06400, partial [Planctomycetaceae bacterium]|nr:hypothetical protein [Planctomycetaceae bacterium]
MISLDAANARSDRYLGQSLHRPGRQSLSNKIAFGLIRQPPSGQTILENANSFLIQEDPATVRSNPFCPDRQRAMALLLSERQSRSHRSGTRQNS